MKSASRLYTCVALTLACVASAAFAADEDEKAIRDSIAATTEAFNRHDAAAFAKLYSEDAHLVTVRGEIMDGRSEIEEGLSTIFRSRAPGATLTQIDVRIRWLSPDVALAHVTNRLSGLRDAAGEPLPPHREHSVRVYVRDSGVWQVAAFQNTRLPD